MAMSKIIKTYTMMEALGELDAIRMEANNIPKCPSSGQNKELSRLISSLSSVMSWLARHLDYVESEIISNILFETEDGPVKRDEIIQDDTKCSFRWTSGDFEVFCEREKGHSGPHIWNPRTGIIYCCDTFEVNPPGGKLSPDEYDRLDNVVLEGLMNKLICHFQKSDKS